MQNKTILLVDYEPKGLSSMKSYLEGLGFTIDTATDGSIALSKFFEKRPDLVVMSPMLPKIHGFDVCRQITQSPEGKDMPVIIVTAVYKGSKYRNEAIHSCGARAYFEKPYAEEELTDTIFKLLNIKKDKPVITKPVSLIKEKSLADILPELKQDRTMPFIKRADLLASLQRDKQKTTPNPEPKQPPDKFVTSEDIFADVIESVEGVPMPKAAPAEPMAPPQEVKVEPPAPIVAVEPPPPLPPPLVETKPVPKVPTPPEAEPPRTRAIPKLDPATEISKLNHAIKKAVPPPPVSKKPESDFDRKLEETLSGLSLDFGGRPRTARPSAPKVDAPQKPTPPVVVPPTPPPAVAKEPPPIKQPEPDAPPPPQVEVITPHSLIVDVAPPQPEPVKKPRVTIEPEPQKAQALKVEPQIETPRPEPKIEPPRVEMKVEAPRPEAKPPEVPRREEKLIGAHVKFGDYVLLEKIATGGMAELFKAKRSGPEGFEKILAIKQILPHLSDNEEFVTMFIDEAKVAAQLNHPNIVHIYDLGRIEDSFFIAMEFVQGKDLRAIIKDLERRDQTMPYDLAAFIGIKVCEALEYAHRKLDYNQKPLNIVHRDVSPQNILISYEGDVKLVDFGVAKAASKVHHTTHGALKGKILYMSPEQAWGKSIDQRSDQFSLGSVLFEVTTGRKLFLGDSEMSTLEAVRNGKVIPPSSVKADFPKPFEEVILRALKPKADERFSSASEMQKTLENYIETVHLRPSTTTLSEFMFRLYSADMKARGILLEPPRKSTIIQKPAEPAVRVEKPPEKPEIKVPPPKVIAAAEKAVTQAPTGPTKEPKVSKPREPELAFKSVMDPAVNTGYKQVKNRRIGIIGAIIAIIVIAIAGIYYFKGRTVAPTQTPPPVTNTTPTPPPVTTPPITTPQPTLPTTTVATPTPEELAAKKKAEEEHLKKLEEDRQKALLAEQQRKDSEAKAAAEAGKQAELEKQRIEEENKKMAEDEAKAAAAAAEAERLRKEEEATKLQQQQAQVKEGDLVQISQVDSRPVPANRNLPVYPEIARRANIQATVKLSILISETGSVIDIKVLSGDSGSLAVLNEAAKKAVTRWTYQPAMKSGKRVKVWVPVDIPFKQ